MQSSPFKSSIFWVSLIVVVASLWIWNGRQERRQHTALINQQLQTQRAASILFRAFYTDNYLTYSAISRTVAHMGDRKMESVARVVHAPQRLSITYQSGAYAGLSGGYNQQLTWRQVAASQPTIPYAELERPAEQVAAERFALMLENYKAHWEGQETISGRTVEVVRLSPLHPVEGARGPARKLWIDAETGLTLRQQSYNYMMMKVMESVLSEVDFSPRITPNTFVTAQSLRVAAQTKPWLAHDAGNNHERVAKLAELYPPEVKSPPPGFQFDSVGTHRCQVCTGSCYATLSRYTDGLNTLTVFALRPKCALANVNSEIKALGNSAQQETAETGKQGLQSCEFGTGTLVMRDLPEGHLIAVADLPAAALQQVLESTVVRAYAASQ